MFKSIRCALDAGNDVIVDAVLLYPEQEKGYCDAAQNADLVWVKIELPLAIVEKREAVRKKASRGVARYYWDRIHEGIVYDLEIDTGTLIPERVAQRLLDFIVEKDKSNNEGSIVEQFVGSERQ